MYQSRLIKLAECPVIMYEPLSISRDKTVKRLYDTVPKRPRSNEAKCRRKEIEQIARFHYLSEKNDDNSVIRNYILQVDRLPSLLQS